MIYILRDRHPGSCPYESALAHERRHQAADEAALAEHRTAPSASGRRHCRELERARRAALAKARAERHAAIDTPAEYRRAPAVCGQTRYRGVRDQVTT
jgi:hypothetical protein